MKKILIVDDLHEIIIPFLEKNNFQVDYQPNIEPAKILEIIADYQGLIVRSKIKIDKFFLDHCDNLAFIGRAGAGLDLIDLQEAQRRNIDVFAANEGNADAVAEHTIGMILGLFNKLNFADAEVRQFIWERERNRGIELKGMTVGIIGFGNMGTAVAQRLVGFGVKVLAYDKHEKDWTTYGLIAQKATLQDIFEQADVVSLHVPLTHETRMMVDDDFLAQFKKNIFLLNTSRGEVVSLKSVYNALQTGKLRGACLDVLEHEKLNKLTPEQTELYKALFQMSNVLFSPHIAGWTVESYRKISEVLMEKIQDRWL
ncbi:MAG: NAD(P)-binding domain-containing protein [Arcicella sp.]|nr:NAD(P)-binding domain-containing protein [Arcicella sp.]